jgi:hypothetical protein
VSLPEELSDPGRRETGREMPREIGPWKWLMSKDLFVNPDI